MSGEGRPGDQHPRTAANELGLSVRGGPIEWADVLDAAVNAYWANRVPITRQQLAAYRREVREAKAQQRRAALRAKQHAQDTTPPAVWLRRAGDAA